MRRAWAVGCLAAILAVGCGKAKSLGPDGSSDARGADASPAGDALRTDVSSAGERDAGGGAVADSRADVMSDRAPDAPTGPYDAHSDAARELAPLDADTSTTLGFCEAYLRARDEYNTRCVGVRPDYAGLLPSVYCPRFVAAVAAGRVAFAADKAASCLQPYATLPCAGDSLTWKWPACQAITRLVPMGGACVPSLIDECAGDSLCAPSAGTCGGTCLPYLPEGAACVPTSLCTTGTLCTDGHCQRFARAGLNQPCSFSPFVSCGDGLYCALAVDAGPSLAGTCKAQPASGPCDGNTVCALPSYCLGPLGAKSCVPRKPIGATCTPGRNECLILAWCAPDGVCTDESAAAGQSCGTLGGEHILCAVGTCTDGTCVPEKKPGDACLKDDECGGGGVTGSCDAVSQTCKTCG